MDFAELVSLRARSRPRDRQNGGVWAQSERGGSRSVGGRTAEFSVRAGTLSEAEGMDREVAQAWIPRRVLGNAEHLGQREHLYGRQDEWLSGVETLWERIWN